MPTCAKPPAMRRAVLALALTNALLCATAFAGDGVWTYDGPDGGFVRNLQAHPTVSGTAFAFEDGGLFRTLDGGVGWQRIESGLPPGLFYSGLAAGQSANVLYVGARSLVFRSDDGGNTWMPTAAAPAGMDYAVSIDVSPTDNNRVAIAAGNRVWTTSNGGTSWTAHPALASDVDISTIRFGLGGVLIAGLTFESTTYGSSEIIRSSDGGTTWSPNTGNPNIFSASILRRAPLNPQRLWFTDGRNLATSADGGLTSTLVNVPLGVTTCNGALSVEPMPSPVTGAVVACSLGGLLRANDATVASPAWTTIASGSGFVNFGSETAIANVLALDAAYPATARIYAGTGGGVLRSIDNGATWARSDTGLQEQRVRAIAMHPTDNRVALIGMSDGGANGRPLFKTTNSAASWSLSASGAFATDWIRTIAIDAASTDSNAATLEPFTVYAAGLSNVSPASGFARDASIIKSTDAGATWVPMNNGIPTQNGQPAPFSSMGTVRSIVLDPRSCAAPPAPPAVCAPGSGSLQRLWVGGTGRFNFSTGAPLAARVFRSIDGAANWIASDTGLPAPIMAGTLPNDQILQSTFVVPIVIHPGNSSILYLGTGVNNFADPPVNPTILNGVFKSIDGGLNWVHSSTGLPRHGGAGTSHLNVLALAISPINPNVLFASVNDLVSGMPVASIYKSIDGGVNWLNASSGIGGADVRALLVDPDDPTGNTVYAGLGGSNAANPGSVYRTINGGANWNAYSLGLPNGAALSLALADRVPGEQARLIAGTSSGVWEFTVPIDLDSDAVGAGMEGMVNGGDGNSDGTLDATQPGVASFNGATAAAGEGVIAGNPPVLPITINIVSGCAQVNNATRYDAAGYPLDTANPNYDHSVYGLVRIELPNCRSAVVDVIFHGADFLPREWVWRNYGPLVPGNERTFGWYAYAGAQRLNATTWRLTLNVAAQGNYRNDGDNILLLGGPTFFAEDLFRDSFE